MEQNKDKQYLINNKPYISFIIPVYNTNDFMLSRCIESVLKLECKNVEIIVINDGSTDNKTIDFLKSCSKYNKVIVIEKENEGPAIARNIGIESAKGEYIVFLDSDDMIATNEFNKIIEILMNNEDVDIVFHSFDIMDDNGSLIRKGNNSCDVLSFSCLNSNRNMFENIVNGLGFDNGVIWSKIYKKSIISNIRFDPELKYCEDNIFNSLISKLASKFLGISISAYIHFENPDSLCHKYNPEAAKDFSVAIKKLQEQLMVSSNINQFYRVVIYHFYIRHVLSLQVFNKNNNYGFFSRCRQAKKILYSDPYRNAFDNINVKGFSLREKLVFKLLKKRLVWFAYKLYLYHNK